MPMPVSDRFNLFDWNARSLETQSGTDRGISDETDPIGQYSFIPRPNVLVERGYALFSADATNTPGNIQAAQLSITGQLPSGVPDTYTLEFDIYFPTEAGEAKLPKDFTSPDARIGVGALSGNGYAAYLLFSQQGMALAASVEDPSPSILGGSVSLMFGDDGLPHPEGLNVRIVVNAAENRMYVYTAKADEAYLGGPEYTDAELRYALAAIPSTDVRGDGVFVEGRARGADLPNVDVGEEVAFYLTSLRLGTGVIFPQGRPVAMATSPVQEVVGVPIQLSGAGSYDANSLQLSYSWDVLLRPESSLAELQGRKYSSAQLGGIDDNNAVSLTFTGASDRFNAYTVIVSFAAPGDLFSTELDDVNKQIKFLLAINDQGDPTTTAADVVAAFDDTRASGYNVRLAGGLDPGTGNALLPLLRAALVVPGSTGRGVLPVGQVAFSGGVGSDLGRPIFIPDVPGVYVFGLIVDNGVRKSFVNRAVCTVQMSEQLLGHRPNTDYIFKYLPDFWSLVSDRSHLEPIWSAITQVISAEMLTAWQNDYAKALRDISRKYQRRWQALPTSEEFDPGTALSLVIPGGRTFEELAVQPAVGGSNLASSSAAFVGSHATAPLTTTHEETGGAAAGVYLNGGVHVLLRTASGPPEVVSVRSVRESVAGSGTWSVYSDTSAFPRYDLISSRTAGYFVSGPVTSVPAVSQLFTDKTYPMSRVNLAKDRIRLHNDEQGTSQIVPATSANPFGLSNVVALDIADQPVDGVAVNWDHLLDLPQVHIERTPYLVFGANLQIDLGDYKTGDVLILRVTDPHSGTEQDIPLSILAGKDRVVFVDWLPLFVVLTALAISSGVEQEWTSLSQLADLTLAPVAVYRATTLAAVDDLVSIPALGISTVDRSLLDTVDYHVTDSSVEMVPHVTGRVKFVANSNRVEFLPGHRQHYDAPGGAFGGNSTALHNAGLSTLVITSGPSGVYGVLGFDGESTVLVDREFSETGEALAHIPRYSLVALPPAQLWAETAYYDNSAAIENNFGLFVGLPRSVVEAADPTLDYLSIVRSTWFAFLSGPSLDNLQMAVQSFLGLPFAEQAGRIIHIGEPGHIVIRDENGDAKAVPDNDEPGVVVVRNQDGSTTTQYYRLGATIATNPRTGRPYAAHSSAEVPSTDSPAYPTYLDAQVGAYEKLVDVVSLVDYVDNPDLIQRQFAGSTETVQLSDGRVLPVDAAPTLLEQYHTFVVDVPLGSVGSTQAFDLIREFLNEAKPAYTRFILVGSLHLSDEIDVIDTAITKPTIILKDTPASTPVCLDPATAAIHTSWPNEGTSTRSWGTVVDDPALTPTEEMQRDVTERYESGYCEGVLDDYSGDGSLNQYHHEVDMVNTADSDIDVLRSKVWIPIRRYTNADEVGQNDLEFNVGDQVYAQAAGDPPTFLGWIDHIGAGEHPHVPGVYTPQVEHPYTYLVVNFDGTRRGAYTPDDTTHLPPSVYRAESGHEDLLRAPSVAGQGAVVYTSPTGAKAEMVLAPDLNNASHSKYFLLQYLWQTDKLLEYGPEATQSLALTKYIPLAGITVQNFTSAFLVELAGGAGASNNRRYALEVQRHPYDSAVAENAQFVPSFGPGLFSGWAKRDGVAVNPVVDMVRWGYIDKGDLGTANPLPAIDSYDMAAGDPTRAGPHAQNYVQNIHLGLRATSRRAAHYSHGLVEFYIPAPSIKLVHQNQPGTLRLCGFYMCADDPTRVNIPTSIPASYGSPPADGLIGGSWVFFRHRDTGVETAASSIVFEIGFHPGRIIAPGHRMGDGTHVFVLGSPNQPSDGHVIEVPSPTLNVEGYYDIVVRNYRPYQMSSGGAFTYHVDEAAAARALFVDPQGQATLTWGTGPFGGA